MSANREILLSQIDEATTRLLGTVRRFSADDVRRPSLLPGWTRAHVLAHLIGGAGALRNLLDSARTRTAIPAYTSQVARDMAIEAGSFKDAATLLGEVRASADTFRATAIALPDAAWERSVRVLAGAPMPATELLVRRLVEVELHHTDLDAGYGVGDWPSSFVELELGEPMRSQRADRLVWSR